MQDKTYKVAAVILMVGVPVVVVLAIGVFMSKDLRLGLFYVLGGACVVVTFLAWVRKKPRLLQILTYDVSAYALWSLVLYHSRLRPHHIFLVSVIGIPVGLVLALLIYRLWKNMKEGIIVYEVSPRKFFLQILLVEAGILVFSLLPIFDSTSAIILDLLWLLTSAALTCLLYLTVAILLLERKTGQKIRYAYSSKQIPWTIIFTAVTSMGIIMALIEIFGAGRK